MIVLAFFFHSSDWTCTSMCLFSWILFFRLLITLQSITRNHLEWNTFIQYDKIHLAPNKTQLSDLNEYITRKRWNWWTKNERYEYGKIDVQTNFIHAKLLPKTTDIKIFQLKEKENKQRHRIQWKSHHENNIRNGKSIRLYEVIGSSLFYLFYSVFFCCDFWVCVLFFSSLLTEVMKKKGSWTWQQKINCKYETLCTTLYNKHREHKHTQQLGRIQLVWMVFGYMMSSEKRSWGHFDIETYFISFIPSMCGLFSRCVSFFTLSQSLSLCRALSIAHIICMCVRCYWSFWHCTWLYLCFHYRFISQSHWHIFSQYVWESATLSGKRFIPKIRTLTRTNGGAAISTDSTFPFNAHRAQHWANALNFKKKWRHIYTDVCW